MNLTNQQIEALKGKCPACENGRFLPNTINSVCLVCQGTGQETINIEKEWVECCDCHLYRDDNSHFPSKHFGNKGQIPKYKVGDEIEVCEDCFCVWIKNKNTTEKCSLGSCICHNFIKLKIISETEDKQKIQMVR